MPDTSDLPDLPARPAPPRPVGAGVRAWIDWFGPLRLVTSAVAVCVVVAGGVLLVRSPPATTEAALPATPASVTVPASTLPPPPVVSSVAQPAQLVVHVAGAVAQPGVYELPTGSRTVAAVESAGGALAGAQLHAVNLAAPLTDGQRVYVPAAGEAVPATVEATEGTATGSPAAPVDLNRASVAELDTLPGIGPATAAAIVEHRDRHGPFATVDDLEQVRGIGPAKLDAIRDLVTL